MQNRKWLGLALDLFQFPENLKTSHYVKILPLTHTRNKIKTIKEQLLQIFWEVQSLSSKNYYTAGCNIKAFDCKRKTKKKVIQAIVQ